MSCAKILGKPFLEILLESIHFVNKETFASRIFLGSYADQLIILFLFRHNICIKRWWQEKKKRASNMWVSIQVKPMWSITKFQTQPVILSLKLLKNLKSILIYKWAIQDRKSILITLKNLQYDPEFFPSIFDKN